MAAKQTQADIVSEILWCGNVDTTLLKVLHSESFPMLAEDDQNLPASANGLLASRKGECSMDIVPYTFNGVVTIPQSPQGAELPGQVQGVYINLESSDYQFILNKVVGWFRTRDEVELIDHGTSDKLGNGYIILEWQERTVDQLFLDILRDEEIVEDYTVYTRDL